MSRRTLLATIATAGLIVLAVALLALLSNAAADADVTVTGLVAFYAWRRR